MTGNLFSNLLSLHSNPVPEEDFFTEVIAWLFDNDQELLFAWLKSFLELNDNYSSCSVETQVVFSKLEHHDIGSRPDILLSLFSEENTDYVIIESKIGSYEGLEQLPRYAEQLAENFPNARSRHLVYITRDYDPKESEVITKRLKRNVIFRQLRWHQIFDFLKAQPSSTMLDEILAFMRANKMTEITRITPAILSAFSAFPDVYKFLDTILKGEVTDRFAKIFGKKPKSGSDQFQHRRHVLHIWSDNWEYLLGFWMPDAGEDFPKAVARLYITPYAKKKKTNELERIYKQIEIDTASNEYCWKSHNFGDPKSWRYIELSCSFSEILGEQDHVAFLRRRLLDYLDETKKILEQYPAILSDAIEVSDPGENQGS